MGGLRAWSGGRKSVLLRTPDFSSFLRPPGPILLPSGRASSRAPILVAPGARLPAATLGFSHSPSRSLGGPESRTPHRWRSHGIKWARCSDLQELLIRLTGSKRTPATLGSRLVEQPRERAAFRLPRPPALCLSRWLGCAAPLHQSRKRLCISVAAEAGAAPTTSQEKFGGDEERAGCEQSIDLLGGWALIRTGDVSACTAYRVKLDTNAAKAAVCVLVANRRVRGREPRKAWCAEATPVDPLGAPSAQVAWLKDAVFLSTRAVIRFAWAAGTGCRPLTPGWGPQAHYQRCRPRNGCPGAYLLEHPAASDAPDGRLPLVHDLLPPTRPRIAPNLALARNNRNHSRDVDQLPPGFTRN